MSDKCDQDRTCVYASKIDSIYHNVNEIMNALKGGMTGETKGLIERVNILESEMSRFYLEIGKTRQKNWWIFTTFVSGLITLITGLVLIIVNTQ